MRGSVQLTQFGGVFNRQPLQLRERKQTVGFALRRKPQMSGAPQSEHEVRLRRIPKDIRSGCFLLNSWNQGRGIRDKVIPVPKHCTD